MGASETPGEEGKGRAEWRGWEQSGSAALLHTPEDRPLSPLLRERLAQGPALGRGWSVHPGLCTQVTPQGPARGASSQPPRRAPQTAPSEDAAPRCFEQTAPGSGQLLSLSWGLEDKAKNPET